ncbi:hypothetical protein SAMN05660462_02116 [Proteiniborus ethanoligenes]|uniref:histidine kinase n=1 Tax=Proteiniborus ethanoligenes TaxID=415015 RepID=A0A1H3QXU0_9FIRM|nr:sensor histidine kinase [Proteiniborus ethanoligenes]SDZ17865.1 hypothetical protein SAMN05660462_02116 [Proteiniborus ethanoligenes]
MDIKLKNKYMPLLIFIVVAYSLSISAFAAFDINNNMDLLTWDPSDKAPSRMTVDYQYYNAIRQRVIKEIPILVAFLFIGAGLIAYGIKEYKIQEYLEKPLKIYRKIPIDFRGGVFLVYSFFILAYLSNMHVFYKPIRIGHFITLSFVSLYIAYFFLNAWDAYKMVTISGYLREQLKESIVYTMIAYLIGSFAVKSVGIKILIITILTAFTGFFFIVFFIGWSSNGFLFLLSGLYMLLYLIFVPYYVIKHVSQLNKIIIGAEEISSGNLNYAIEENVKGHLSRLANNINNMGAGYKKSVENQLKSERLKTELITNVSHDLKTPLTSIINYIDLLKKEDVSEEEAKDYIEILDRKSQRLKTLIDDLFEASKMTSGSIELNIERLDVVALLKQSLAEYDERIKGSSLDFIMNIPEQNVYANLDGKKTWRVFENLINNILKYSMDNTRVYIDIEENTNYAIVTMKNISSHQLDFDSKELFERFIRGDKSRTTEGSGLGLAIAKSIVELQDGRLDIEIDGDLFKAIVYFKK